jgi:hypothetical protein
LDKNEQERPKIRIANPKLGVGQHVRVSKKMKFAKGGEQTYATEVFRIIKVIPRTPSPVNGLEDLNRKVIDGQFHNEELTRVRITKCTIFKIDKILSTRVRRGIREYLVRWKIYGPDFDSWINAASVKNIYKWILVIAFTLLCLAMPHLKHIPAIRSQSLQYSLHNA